MRTGYMAIGFAAVVGVDIASFARASPVLDHCKFAGTEIEAEEQHANRKAGSDTGIFVAVPIGRVCIGPEVVDGEPSYVRRITVSEGMSVVEVSTTPLMPDLPSGEASPGVIARPDQPASW